MLADAGFTITGRDQRITSSGVAAGLVATDRAGASWLFDVAGPLTSYRGGLARLDAVWRALGRAAAITTRRGPKPFVLLTTQLPPPRSPGDSSMRAAGPDTVFDVVDMLDPAALQRLARYAAGGHTASPAAGFWTDADLGA